MSKKLVPLSEAREEAERGLALWPIRRALAATLAVGLVLIAGLTVAGLALLGFHSIQRQPNVPIATFFDILKLAFGAVAGIGAAVALLMAYRKQRVAEAAQKLAEAANHLGERAHIHTEKVAKDNAHDATERRVTELYGRAVDQLGHEKAAVRLGGLYSLARLGQAHPEHRQTVVDMICAYLRMPFQIPANLPDTQTLSEEEGDLANREIFHGLAESELRQEVHVRLTAQRLLARHLSVLQPDHDLSSESAVLSETFWESMTIDLTGAVLINFDFSGCCTSRVDFRETRFSGPARFDGARFSGPTRFDGARFSEDSDFRKTRFSGPVGFSGAQFSGDAWFGGAQFSGTAGFSEAQFSGDAWFGGARFSGDAGFSEAQFSEVAEFDGVQFSEVAKFDETRFSGPARFDGARFNGTAWFGEARFSGDAKFHGVQFSGPVGFSGAQFNGTAWFGEARFSGAAWFGEARFSGAQFSGAQFSGTAGFSGAQFSGDAWFSRAQFSGPAWFDCAQFNTDARFNGAQGSGTAGFDRAQFSGDAWFSGAQFSGPAGFGGAQFNGTAGFDRAKFDRPPNFYEAHAKHLNDGHVWPPGWGLERPPQHVTMAQLVVLPGNVQTAATPTIEAD